MNGQAPRAEPRRESEESPLPGWRDPAVAALLLFVLALQLGSWSATEGYQLADSVEFMERARCFVHGIDVIDSTAIRPFGFSTVLLPFFFVADRLGVTDQRQIVWVITLLQMALGLGLVLSTIRIGTLLGGRRAGLLAGILAGANPVFLQYSSQPISGLAAGCLAGFAVEVAIRRRDFRGGLKSGLLFAGAFLMAYQSLLIAGGVALLVLLRGGVPGRISRTAAFLGIALGLAIGIALQAGTDWIVYGQPGASLVNHFVQNAGFILASFCVRIGLRSVAKPIYEFAMSLQGREVPFDATAPPRALMSAWFYVVQLPTMLVWPAILGLALGLARAIRRPGWTVGLPVLALLVNVFVMSNKGSKDFRLWLPLLPIVGALCAYGWTWLAPRGAGTRRTLDAAFALSVVVLGLVTLAPQGSRRYGTYWRAMDWVNERAQEIRGGRPAPVRVASAYNWAVYLREREGVDLIKLPRQLNLWSRYPPEHKQEDFEALERVEIFFCHLPILTTNPDLLAFVAERFEMAGAVHDQTIDLEGLGPILILEKRSGRPRERLLYEIHPSFEPRLRSSTWPPAHFVDRNERGEVERLVLEDWRYEVLPPEGLGWITYRWTTPTGITRDYLLLDRITAPDEQGAWQNDHRPAWNQRNTSTLRAGETITEGYLVVPSTEPYVPGGPYRPIGGSYRRGDSIPATLWMAAVDFDPDALARRELVVRARLAPAEPGSDVPLAPGGGTDPREGPGGFRFTPDGLVRVGTFFLPVPPASRVPGSARP